MKKVLSVFLAICVMLMTSITAFAAEVPSSEKVWAQIEGAAAYLTNGVDSYGVDQAIDFSILVDSGADMSKYEEGFINDVKANLDANDGKIVSKFGESLEVYGAVIVSLTGIGEDTTDFYGYDIEKVFLAMDPTVAPASPNYYRIITEAAACCMDESAEAFLEKVCDTYISNYYVMGQGANYSGYSCDNTAYFIDAITWSASDKYTEVLDDAIKVIDTYKTDGGYFYSTTNWDGTPVTEFVPNADSTALALLAHCVYSPELNELDEDADDDAFEDAFIRHCETVNAIYADLCTFEGSSTGVFTYDGDDSAYATKEALIALQYYYTDVIIQEIIADYPDDEEDPTVPEEEITVKKPTVTKAETTTTTTAKANTSKKSPNTGSDATAVSAAIALCAAAGVLTVLKKKER